MSEHEIAQIVARGATDEEAVGRACGAGEQCGGCRSEVRRICESMLANAALATRVA